MATAKRKPARGSKALRPIFSPFSFTSFDWHDLYWCAVEAAKQVDGPARAALEALALQFANERDRVKKGGG